ELISDQVKRRVELLRVGERIVELVLSHLPVRGNEVFVRRVLDCIAGSAQLFPALFKGITDGPGCESGLRKGYGRNEGSGAEKEIQSIHSGVFSSLTNQTRIFPGSGGEYPIPRNAIGISRRKMLHLRLFATRWST